MSDLVVIVAGVAWVGAGLLLRGRGPVASLAGLTALGWFATLLLPAALLWHRGPLVHLLLAGGTWGPRSWTARGVAVVGYAGAVLVWPWVLPWTGAALAVAILVASVIETRRHRESPLRSGTWRAATVLAAFSFAAPPVLTAAHLPRSWAIPVLVGYAVTQVVVAALVVMTIRPRSSTWATDLAVELGTASHEQLVRALGTTIRDPGAVIEQARAAQAAAAELHDRLSTRQEHLAATLTETEQSRRRLELVDSEERLALRRALEDVAMVRLQDAAHRLASSEEATGPSELTEPVRRALRHLRLTIVEMDALGKGLAPGALAAGLGRALVRLAAAAPVKVSLEGSEESSLGGLPEDIASCAYYVAAEALANVVKHAEATAVLLRVRVHDTVPCQVELVVADDGRGVFGEPGAGLNGLTARAEEIGGRVEIASRPGQGTRVRLTLPIRESVRT